MEADAERWRAEGWAAPLPWHGVRTASTGACGKTVLFLLFPFFNKMRILFGFLSVSENRYYCRIFVK